MKKVAALALTVALGAGAVFAEPLLPRNLAAGKALPDSQSPDKRFVILEVFHDGSTQNSVVITPTDRSKYLGFVPIHTEWGTDKPHKGRTTTRWNTISSLVSVHDSFSKHSKLHIFRVTDAGAKSLVLPDLLKRCASDLAVPMASVRSSGQLPTKWVDDSVLEVTVRLKTNQKGSLSKRYRLSVGEDGKVALSPPKR